MFVFTIKGIWKTNWSSVSWKDLMPRTSDASSWPHNMFLKWYPLKKSSGHTFGLSLGNGETWEVSPGWWWIRVPKSVRRYDSGTTGRGVTSILKIWEITYNNVLQRWCFFKKLTFLYSWWSKDNVRKTIYMMTIRMMIKMIFRMIFRMMKNDTNKDSVYWNFYLTSQWSDVKAWLTA